MALDDKDIFAAIWSKYSDQPIEIVMAQYERAKLLNIELEARLSMAAFDEDEDDEEFEEETEVEIVPEAEEISEPSLATLKRKYNKRTFKVKPQNAITDEYIACCICGEKRKALTGRHIATHDGMTVEQYKEICGYPPKTPLMSGQRLAQSRNIIKLAQKKRDEKKAEKAQAEGVES